MANPNATYNPKPETIRAICLQIQSGWTETERRNRQMYDVLPMQIPETRLSTSVTAMDEEGY